MSTKPPLNHRKPWPALCLLAATAISMPTMAESAKKPDRQRTAYASLPLDMGATRGLPGAGPAPARTLHGFASAVDAGAIVLRASAPSHCLPGALKTVLAEVSRRFGTVSVESTHRTYARNLRAGGARTSLHLSCRAIDFRVKTRARGVMAYLRSRPEVGGLKIYRNGIIHIDNGARRSW